ncbi:NADH dehydrogenase subunit N [Microbulbifer thermotolerans]|uniref:NADH-quinone oxidoreductase subunit N n=1 Tax=Microbulbifer thermotolerans TaxID=252514 RepID=UPI0008ED7459|nr:NADH-quinone oxidoreductase subunit N [Microbulbifer thermotolerans]SFC68126.1 NADH dehydrogenase subunit N [Microbulbifer thermotolerans]
MSARELHAILPLLILSGGILFLLLQVSFLRSHKAAAATAVITLIAAIAACFDVARTLSQSAAPIEVTGLLLIDQQALFFCLLFLLAALAIAVLGFSYLQKRCDSARESIPEAFYLLLLLVMLGAMALVFSNHFASVFLSMELMSLALYPMLGFAVTGDLSPRLEQMYSLESGVKYLLLSALSTALGLFGMALIYAACGALDFGGVAAAVANLPRTPSLLLSGLTLLLITLAFKLSLVPFHIWTPDVYQGAPSPVTALIATVGKGAVVALLLRLFTELELFSIPALTGLLAAASVASMLVGNLLALMQKNIKRLLAYSSIAHIGYLLVAFLIGNSAFGNEAVLYYLVAYVITTLGAFGAVGLIADSALARTAGSAGEYVYTTTSPFQRDFYRGLLWRSPWLAGCLAAMLLSLAGIPLTIGFIGKFYIFAAGIQGQLRLLLAAVVIGSAIGLFYYLRLLLTMVLREPQAPLDSIESVRIAVSGRLLLISLTGVLLIFGVFPQILIDWIYTL